MNKDFGGGRHAVSEKSNWFVASTFDTRIVLAAVCDGEPTRLQNGKTTFVMNSLRVLSERRHALP